MTKLTKAQRALLTDLNEFPDMIAECAAELEWRSAKALAARGLVEVFSEPNGARIGEFFDCKITPAGRAAIFQPADTEA